MANTPAAKASTNPITVKLTTDKQQIADNEVAKLTFTFSDKPIGFGLDDIKVTFGAVTNLVQSSTNPCVYTADFIGGLSAKSYMSTVKLDGLYTDALGKAGTPSDTVTIKNLDSKITPSAFFSTVSVSTNEGDSGTRSLSFVVNLSAPVTESVTVAYSTDAMNYGTATPKVDYLPAVGKLTFAPGEVSRTITVDVIGDKAYEANEYFYLKLTSAVGANIVLDGAESGKRSYATGYINNDDVSSTPSVSFAAGSVTVTEGDSGTKAMEFKVTLSAPASSTVTVAYSTDAMNYGTATPKVDYLPAVGQLTFAPGETSKSIFVDVIGDKTYESNEYFYLKLTSATGANVVLDGAEAGKRSYMTGYITNDDANPLPTVSFSTASVTASEGNAGSSKMSFKVDLSAASTSAVSVSYSTDAMNYGTATPKTDYVPAVGTLTFAPGETSKTISVDILGDTNYEANEYFYLKLTSATGANVVLDGAEAGKRSYATGYINNDDAQGGARTYGIFGTSAKDTIGGKADDDYIDGKGGADLITGYAGNDTFVFAKTYAAKTVDTAATITDFKHGTDHIGLLGDLDFSGLKLTQGTGAHAADTIVSLGSGDVLAILVGVNSSTLGAADFTHVA